MPDLQQRSRRTQKLVRQLEAVSAGTRIRAAKHLAKIGGRQAAEALYGVLDHQNSVCFHAFIQALETIGDPVAAQPLLSMLNTVDEERSLLILQALGKLGNRETTTALKSKLVDFNPKIRVAVAQALNNLGDTQWKPLINGTQKDFEHCVAAGDIVVAEHLLALSYSRCTASAGTITRPSVLIYAFQKQSKAAEGLLCHALQSPQHTVRREAAYMLGQLQKEALLTDPSQTADTLCATVDDSNDEVSLEAIQALNHFPLQGRVEETMLYGLTGSKDHRLAAINFLESHPEVPMDLSADAKREILGYASNGYVLSAIESTAGWGMLFKLITRALNSQNEQFVLNMLAHLLYGKRYDTAIYEQVKPLAFNDNERIRTGVAEITVKAALDGGCQEATNALPGILMQYCQNEWALPTAYLRALDQLDLPYEILTKIAAVFQAEQKILPNELLLAMLKSDRADTVSFVLALLKQKQYAVTTKFNCYARIGGNQGMKLLLDECRKYPHGYNEALAEAFTQMNDERALPLLYSRFLNAQAQESMKLYAAITHILENCPDQTVLSDQQIRKMEDIKNKRSKQLAEGERAYNEILYRGS